jgi:3-isopropylmalate dehydrogenase
MIEEAGLAEKAIANVLDKGLRTGDIMQEGMTKVSTVGMGEAIIGEMETLAA